MLNFFPPFSIVLYFSQKCSECLTERTWDMMNVHSRTGCTWAELKTFSFNLTFFFGQICVCREFRCDRWNSRTSSPSANCQLDAELKLRYWVHVLCESVAHLSPTLRCFKGFNRTDFRQHLRAVGCLWQGGNKYSAGTRVQFNSESLHKSTSKYKCQILAKG